MSNKIKFAIFTFLAVCCMGLFVALAGGIHWGTGDAGAMSFITLLLATKAFFAVKADW